MCTGKFPAKCQLRVRAHGLLVFLNDFKHCWLIDLPAHFWIPCLYNNLLNCILRQPNAFIRMVVCMYVCLSGWLYVYRCINLVFHLSWVTRLKILTLARTTISPPYVIIVLFLPSSTSSSPFLFTASTSCLKTGPVQTGNVRVEFTGNSDSYTTRTNVNGCQWIALNFMFPGTRTRINVNAPLWLLCLSPLVVQLYSTTSSSILFLKHYWHRQLYFISLLFYFLVLWARGRFTWLHYTFTALQALHATRSSYEKVVCPSVCLSVRPSVCLSNACIVTERKKNMSRFLRHTKDRLT